MNRPPDPRFSLANERTYLAWVRTALALVAAGLVAAKALDFDHEALRWVVALPPVLGGAAMAFDAQARWRAYERAMAADEPLPAGRSIALVSGLVVVWAVVVLFVTVLD